MNFHTHCKICLAPVEVRELIDRELSKPRRERKPLRQMEKETGFSKSLLSKHSIKHMTRDILVAYREQTRVDWMKRRKIVAWPDTENSRVCFLNISTPELWPAAHIERNELAANDVLIRIRYGPLTPEKPKLPPVSPYDATGPQPEPKTTET